MTTRLLVFLSLALITTFGCSTPSPQVDQLEPGREVVARMIEAHGGLEKWRSAPTVSFEAALLPPGADAPLVHRVTVEQGARRAYLDFPGMNAKISWDGEKAWSENWKGPFPPRFFALLSYYFMNLPWLAADPGVGLSEPGTARLWDDPTEYITVVNDFRIANFEGQVDRRKKVLRGPLPVCRELPQIEVSGSRNIYVGHEQAQGDITASQEND